MQKSQDAQKMQHTHFQVGSASHSINHSMLHLAEQPDCLNSPLSKLFITHW
jgi:hypothetical protein